jgi:hypothetical protein
MTVSLLAMLLLVLAGLQLECLMVKGSSLFRNAFSQTIPFVVDFSLLRYG